MRKASALARNASGNPNPRSTVLHFPEKKETREEKGRSLVQTKKLKLKLNSFQNNYFAFILLQRFVFFFFFVTIFIVP